MLLNRFCVANPMTTPAMVPTLIASAELEASIEIIATPDNQVACSADDYPGRHAAAESISLQALVGKPTQYLDEEDAEYGEFGSNEMVSLRCNEGETTPVAELDGYNH